MRLLIKGGRVVDPASGRDEIADVLIGDGRIESVAPRIEAPADQVVNAEGLVVAPGFVDLHAHFGVGEWEERESFASGAAAAARGGYTTVVVRPGGPDSLFDPDQVGGAVARARRETSCRILIAASLWRGSEAAGVSEAYHLRQAGAVALAAEKAAHHSLLFRRALEYSSSLGLPLLLSAIHPDLDEGGIIHEGKVSARLGLPGLPRSGEILALHQALVLAQEAGARVHVGPVSTAEGVELIRRAKSQGLPVTAETTIHHLVFTEDAADRFALHAKLQPPLREARDLEALREAAADGTLDCVVSDHRPLKPEESEVELDQRPFGASALETVFAAGMTHLVAPGILSLSRWLELLTAGPARVLGLEAGRLAEGSAADIALIAVDEEWTLEEAAMASWGKNTLFARAVLRGRVKNTLLGGTLVQVEAAPAGR